MKSITFILAFLILTLGVMPCADVGAFMNDGKVKTAVTEANRQDGSQHPDDCSPFCSCTCCAGFLIDHSFAAMAALPVFCNNPMSHFLPPNIAEVAFSFWQPPRSC